MDDDLTPLYDLIRRFEGCKLRAYLCPAGVWTCGWGSTGEDVSQDTVWTQEYADQRMFEDAARFAREVKEISPSLKGKALCAIADFAYNLGSKKYRVSTLRRRIDAGDMEAAKGELARWVWGGGKILKGLVARRAAEAKLLTGG